MSLHHISVRTKRILALLLLLATAIGSATPANAAEEKRKQPLKTWRGGGQMIPDVPRDQIICFALYTVQHNILKLSAQFYPLLDSEERNAVLEIKQDNQWQTVARSEIDSAGWLATFRVENWDHSQDTPYRVTHSGGASYEGLIRKDPIDKHEIVVAAFTGNSNSDRGPRADIIANIRAQDPDLLFFSGDQSYDHQFHTAAWLLFGRQFGEIIRDRPTVTIPDDHDVGQGNLWGANGKVSKLPGGADGGYIMPADYVRMVERAQTSHLPDPYDPTPIQQGINVYYTSLNVGGIDFAIIEDRKFKTGPAGLIPKQGPRPDHITSTDYDPQAVDVPEARLLGDRQLEFLHQWGQDWTRAEMKAVLSQTIFAGGAHIHGKIDARLVADLDSNGWPQAGRARALRELRCCFAFHLAGDQHLATVIHHGINSWEDAGYSFCVPSIVNFYGRWWHPLEAPLDHDDSNPLPYTGRYFDGFKNKVTMHAYANPTNDNDNAAGYGLVRFNKPAREINLECWPRYVDVTQPDAKQFPGWPVTIAQQDNYGRTAVAWLPTLKINGSEDPVVRVTDDATGEVVYTLRIRGNTWQPKVFREGNFTIQVTAGKEVQVFKNIKSEPDRNAATLTVSF
ncbi:MAG: hypothetical protein KDA57_11180 [Planctomycetales bacterium]|nr:hypothetical protein [Planctomycetales bacterium]